MYEATTYAKENKSITGVDGKSISVAEATQSQLKKIYDRNQKKLVKKINDKSQKSNTETRK